MKNFNLRISYIVWAVLGLALIIGSVYAYKRSLVTDPLLSSLSGPVAAFYHSDSVRSLTVLTRAGDYVAGYAGVWCIDSGSQSCGGKFYARISDMKIVSADEEGCDSVYDIDLPQDFDDKAKECYAHGGQGVSLANPASVGCSAAGGELLIKSRGDGGQYGLCTFDDGRACEEWAMLRGECPVGGIKTTGYDNEAQKYCAWIGGKTTAIPNAVCTKPDGMQCLVSALYGGACDDASGS